MPNPLIRLQQVTKSYTRGGETLRVLDRLDLEMEAGGYFALMGPSGSGKTTLLNLLGGLDQPDSGVIEVAGEDLMQLSGAELARWRSRYGRLRLPGLQPDPGADGARERRAAAQADEALAARERREHALHALELVGLSDRAQAPAAAALRRTGAARRDRARRRQRPAS